MKESTSARRKEALGSLYDAFFTKVANGLDEAAKWMDRQPWIPGRWDYTKINVVGLAALLLILGLSLALNVILILL